MNAHLITGGQRAADGVAVLADRRDSSVSLTVTLVLVAAAMVFGVVVDRARKARNARTTAALAISHGLLPDNAPMGFPTGTFERIPARSRLSNMLRDGARPQERYGFLIHYRQGKSTISRTVGAFRSTAHHGHITLLRQGLLGGLNWKDIDIGDEEFDKRWVVKGDDPAYVHAVLTPTLRAWLMTFEDKLSAPTLEARDGDVIAVAEGQQIERIPELLEVAETFDRYLRAGTRQH